jgi:hypothetical protein
VVGQRLALIEVRVGGYFDGEDRVDRRLNLGQVLGQTLVVELREIAQDVHSRLLHRVN